MEIMLAAVVVSLFEIGSDRRAAYERSRCIPYPKAPHPLGECAFNFPLHRARGRGDKLAAKLLKGVYLGLRLGTNEMYISTAKGVGDQATEP